MFIEKENVQWKQVPYLRQGETRNYDYTLTLNEPLASWDVWDYWERERIESMRTHLSKGDILFDVGTESGWCNLVYAQIVGPENMVLVEPSPEFWPNIKALWEKNFGDVMPMACYAGFFSDRTSNFKVPKRRMFPPESDGALIDKQAYRNIFDNQNKVQQMTIDDFVYFTGIKPKALTIDVEGAEFLVLEGALNLLAGHKMKVWVSEHDDLALNNYGVEEGQVCDFMDSIGYKSEVLATNHERHIYYHK